MENIIDFSVHFHFWLRIIDKKEVFDNNDDPSVIILTCYNNSYETEVHFQFSTH